MRFTLLTIFFVVRAAIMEHLVQITRMPSGEFQEMISELDVRTKARLFSQQLPLLKLSKYVSERTVTDPAEAIPECTGCGVCCNYHLLVPVRREESEDLDEFVEVMLDGIQAEAAINRVLPRNPETGSCKFLNGTLGTRVGCTIYEKRPHVCHDFDAGSDRCHELRRMYGIERQLTKDEVEAAVERLDKQVASTTIKYVSIVADSTVSHLDISSAGVEHYESTMLKIVAFLDEELTFDLHLYDANKEVWFESDLVGHSLDEAREIIRSRSSIK